MSNDGHLAGLANVTVSNMFWGFCMRVSKTMVGSTIVDVFEMELASLSSIGDVPPAEFEEVFYSQTEKLLIDQ